MSAPVLITGGRGFIGQAAAHAFRQAGHLVYTLGPAGPGDDSRFHLPISRNAEAEALGAHLRTVKPATLLHLAAAPPDAPDPEHRSSVLFTQRLLQAVEKEAPDTIMLHLGSAAEYGKSLFLNRPLVETDPCEPLTPYGRAKHAATLLMLDARRHGLHATVARLFTAVGPGMPRHTALGSAIFQLSQMEGPHGVLHVGNLETFRDYLDVRDVAAFLLALTGQPAENPPLVHLCSGEPQKIGDWLKALAAAAGKDVSFVTDPSRVRSNDPQTVVGSTALMKTLGLAPRAPDMTAVAPEILGVP
jgi:nucleoside-diphosphate-sugar epimerase